MSPPASLRTAWARFLDRERLRLAPSSLENRSRVLGRLFEFMRAERLERLGAGELARYLVYLKTRLQPAPGRAEPSAATWRSHLGSLRIWLRFLHDDGHELEPVYVYVPRGKGVDGRRAPLSQDEIEAWLALCDLECPLGLRDRAIFELAYGSGLRRGEILGLELSHLDLAGGTLFVVSSKNGHARMAPVTRNAVAYLELYLHKGRPQLIRPERAGERVFLSCRGGPLSVGGFKDRIAIYRRCLAFGAKIGMHSLRHSFATHLVQAGADVRHVGEMLGHRGMSSTAIYTEVTSQDLEGLRQAHPRG